MAARIIQKSMISPKATKELIMTMAIWGNDYNYRLTTEKEVSEFFQKKGINFRYLIQQCRNYSQSIPHVENLIGPTYEVSDGVKISKVDMGTDEAEFTVEGPGVFTTSDYWGKFANADHKLRNSIESASFQEFQNAVVIGMASIESYINYRAIEWNRKNPGNQIDITARISLDEKIDLWIPIILNGKEFVKGQNKHWSDYQLLKPIRDDIGIHSKKTASGSNYRDLVKFQNLYRSGIAGLLMDLHKLFDERMPAVIIRRYYAPEVVLQDN